uniref:Serum amyloid A protein n=1 Tax=Rhabditophanes sp. KR3021 TaxID=114890 RepID=A0AC35THN2_9BILA
MESVSTKVGGNLNKFQLILIAILCLLSIIDAKPDYSKWNQSATLWGKRSGGGAGKTYGMYDEAADFYLAKRPAESWQNMNSLWGKRSGNWNGANTLWGKRSELGTRQWNNANGLWGRK